jgi:hypothetical protein
VAIEQLDPQHELPLLIAGSQVVEELQRRYEHLLVRIDDALPLVFVLCACLAIITSSRHPDAYVDQGEDILVEQPVGGQVLHLFPERKNVPGNCHKLIQSLEVSEQVGRVRSNERARQAFIFGRSGIWGGEGALFERGNGGFYDAGEIIPELVGQAKFFSSRRQHKRGGGRAMGAGIPQFVIATRLFERLGAHIMQHAQSLG